MATTHVGFIGLGNMGGAIAERLARSATVHLHVFDRVSAAAERLRPLGANLHDSARSVAHVSEIVFTCLPSVEACRDTLFGAEGVAGASAVRHCVEMSTIGPSAMREFAQRMAQQNIRSLDAPVSGGAAAALGGTLSIMMAGAEPVREAVMPVLQAITSKLFFISEQPGDAQTMKLVNNLLAAVNMASSFEALVLGTKLGLDPKVMIEVVNASSGRNTGMDERKTGAILSRRFEGLGKIALLEKDIRLAFEVAVEGGVPLSAMPAISGAAELWRRAVEQGMQSEDVSALVKVVERAAGQVVGKSSS